MVYVLVPEKHQDGAWHLHGVIRGLPADAVSHFVRGVHPEKLVNGGFLNWDDYSSRFGYCSLGLVRDPVKVAFYLAKYITKDMGENIRRVGSHMYYASRGIKKRSTMETVTFQLQNWIIFFQMIMTFAKRATAICLGIMLVSSLMVLSMRVIGKM